MADHHDAHHHHAPSNTHYLLLLLGGLLIGMGVVSLYFGFGHPDTDLNGDMQIMGYTAIDNIRFMSPAFVGFGLVAAGAATLVFLNARAWRYTDGY